MDKYNNMGGILFASILFTSEFDIFTVLGNTAYISIKKGHAWRNLPISFSITAPDVTPVESVSGITYTISSNIPILRACLSSDQADIIRTGLREGCVLMCQDCAGYKFVYGTPEHPLQGTLTEKIGKKKTDFSFYDLKLTAKSAHPQLIPSGF